MPDQEEQIENFCRGLAASFKPSRIILFGSRAKGTHRRGSDVDLLVAMPRVKSGPQLAAKMIAQLHPAFGLDLIVKSEKEIQRRVKQQDFFLIQALAEGRVLYEAPHA
jgi:predicted nucleotidyltransferase